MKTKILFVLIAFVFTSISLYAQSSFDEEMTNLHKNAINNCGMIKSPGNHNSAEILQSLNKLKDEVAADEAEYVKNPPADYAKDPLLKSYFEELDDIIDALKTRVGKDNYGRAAMNCSRICMVFNKMHMNNGKLDLTDMMFSWKMQMTITMNMLNAGNTEGANENNRKVRMVHDKMILLKNKKNDNKFNKQFEAVDDVYLNWISALDNKNIQDASTQFSKFNKIFSKVFMMSL